MNLRVTDWSKDAFKVALGMSVFQQRLCAPSFRTARKNRVPEAFYQDPRRYRLPALRLPLVFLDLSTAKLFPVKKGV
jgi:hypothetical protein